MVRTSPTLLKKPAAKRVLVLAPHPDDEVIGCGGVIRQHVKAGDIVHVVYLTDGSEGRTHDQAREEVSPLRQREAAAGLAKLGVTSSTWLGLEDSRLSPSSETVNVVAAQIRDFQPQAVYCTFVHDQHDDHRAAARILADALQQLAYDCQVVAYEVWSPFPIAGYLNITEEWEFKREALLCHQSQLRLADYEQLTRGLNSYRAALYGAILRIRADKRAQVTKRPPLEPTPVEVAEGFLTFDAASFIQAVEIYGVSYHRQGERV